MFADLVDFTVLSRQLDAEDTREVVNAYFARWQRAIEDHGGVVEKFIGDAVMAVFGLSRSFEDDAHRAIRSALAMLADLEDLNADLVRRFGVTLHMRVGIDTGEVVVSTLGERAGGGFVAVGPDRQPGQPAPGCRTGGPRPDLRGHPAPGPRVFDYRGAHVPARSRASTSR